MKNAYINIRKAFLPMRMLVLLGMMFVFGSGALGAREIFADLVEAPQVESTYISGRMAIVRNNEMSSMLSEMMTGVSIDTSNFSEMYIYNVYSEASVKKARQILDNYLSRAKDVELAFRNRNSLESYLIYKKMNKDGLKEEVIIWSSAGPNTCQIVVLEWDPEEETSTHSVRREIEMNFDFLYPRLAGLILNPGRISVDECGSASQEELIITKESMGIVHEAMKSVREGMRATQESMRARREDMRDSMRDAKESAKAAKESAKAVKESAKAVKESAKAVKNAQKGNCR